MEIPGYTIEHEIGRGGMATVYLAVQESVHRHVALKVMSRALASEPTFTERFLREARIAAQFHHPHIITVHDLGVHEDWHYIAMEYHAGGHLNAAIKDGVTAENALRIAKEVASALAYLHDKGYVHRDLKPDNILFRENGSAVLSDFGVVRAADSATQITKTGSVMGTPHYMSPEQARGLDIDGRSDLYSLGICLYQMLAGRVPYDAADSFAVCAMHVNEPIPRLEGRLGRYQPLIDGLLAKRPGERYADAHQLIADLERAQAGVDLISAKRNEHAAAGPPPMSARDDTPALGDMPRIVPGEDGAVSEAPTRVGVARSSQRPARRRRGRWASVMLLALIAVATVLWQRPQLRPAWLVGDRPQALSVAEAALAAGSTERLDQARGQLVALLGGPDDAHARAGLRRLAEGYSGLARKALERGATARAGELLARATRVRGAAAMGAAGSAVAGGDSAGEDAEGTRPGSLDRRVRALIERADQALAGDDLPPPAEHSAHAAARKVLSLVPGHSGARERLRRLSARYVQAAEEMLSAGELKAVERHLEQARSVMPQNEQPEGVAELEAALAKRRERGQRIEELLATAHEHLEADRLTRPDAGNAYAVYRRVLEIDPDNAEAKEGVEAIVARYKTLAEAALTDGEPQRARRYVERAADLAPASGPGTASGLEALRERVAERLANAESATEASGAESTTEASGAESQPERSSATDAQAAQGADVQSAEAEQSGPQVPVPHTPKLSGDEPIGELHRRAQAALEDGRDMAAYGLYRAIVARKPRDYRALRRLQLGAERYVRLAQRAIQKGELERARRQLSTAQAIAPDFPGIARAARRLREAERESGDDGAGTADEPLTRMRVRLLLADVDEVLDKDAPLTAEEADRAYDSLQGALKIAPRHEGAHRRLRQLADVYVRLADEAVAADNVSHARRLLTRAERIAPDHPELLSVKATLEQAAERGSGS